MYFQRKKEFEALTNLLNSGGHAILLYGKRRVGKTTLIKEVVKNKKYLYFECLADSLDNNLISFTNELKNNGMRVPSFVNFNSFVDAFEYLDSLNVLITVVIDEYPYLKSLNNSLTVDSLFQKIIDNHLHNINLVVLGSQMKIMEELLYEGNPLSGRFNLSILLEEMNYKEVSAFYSDKSIYDKVAFYSVFGGSPYINRSIDPTLDLRSNIINTFLKTGSEVYNYANNIAITDVANKLQAQRILSFIGNGKKRYSDISSILDIDKTGIINKPLNSLLDLKIISKRCPINKLNDNKKIRYEIEDNVLRFFYTYVYNRGSTLFALGEEAFYDQYIAPTINEYISLRYERIVKDYFSLLCKENKLSGIRNIGTYYYDDPVNKKNGEFDIALETNDGYEIYEAKYLKDKMKKSQMHLEAEQIKNIREIKVTKIGFVSISGFEDNDPNFILIDGNDLYNL